MLKIDGRVYIERITLSTFSADLAFFFYNVRFNFIIITFFFVCHESRHRDAYDALCLLNYVLKMFATKCETTK